MRRLASVYSDTVASKMVQSSPAASSVLGNRYKIEQQVDKQSKQSLYLGQDQLNGDACIIQKVLAPSNAQATVFAQHVQNEVASFLNWQHPQFEQIRDCFVEGSSVILVKDKTEGQTLRERLSLQGSLSETELRPVLESVLVALSSLHQSSITHANISPETLLLRTTDQQPVLTQFRFVRDVLGELGAIALQPRLMEQAKALTSQAMPSGAAEDLYTLALTSIILLTGKELSALYNTQTQSWTWEDYQLVTDSLSNTLSLMLSGTAEERFTSADAFLQSLQATAPTISAPASSTAASPSSPTTQVATPQPVSSTAQIAGTVIKQQYQRNRGLTIAAGLGLSAALATGAFFAFRGKPQPKVVVPLDATTSPNVATPNSQGVAGNNSPTPTTIQVQGAQDRSQLTTQPLGTATAIPEAPTNTSAQLSEDEAVSLIQNWITAKRTIFASPFDAQLAGSLTTGKLYYDITKPGGSIDWLKENGAYYKFGTQEVISDGQFTVSGDRASIKVKVEEDRTLYVRGRIDRSNSGFKTNYLRYDLFLENGVWKIEDYE